MTNNVVPGNFSAIQARARTVLTSGKKVLDPFKSATTLKIFQQTVADGRRLLPTRYQARYVDVLDNIVRQAAQILHSLHPRDGASRRVVLEQLQDIFSLTAAPIVQLKSSAQQRELKAFLVLISNIYRRFINDKLVQKGAKFKILSPDLDPLGSFGHDDTGPFTLPASVDLPVAIVSKPAREMHFLPFWAADGHEVGGHDIYGAVQGFEAELEAAVEAGIRAAFKSGQVKPSVKTVRIPYRGWLSRSKTISMEEFMVRVWKAWLPEVSSDHAGLGNIGPMYLNSLMLLLSCVRPYSTLKDSAVYNRKLFAASDGYEPHPVDVVRVLACAEAMKQLHLADGCLYAQALTDRLVANLGGTLPANVRWFDLKDKTAITVPLCDFQAVLPVVSDVVLKKPLQSLAGQAFQDIINWRDDDEATVKNVAGKLCLGNTEVGAEAEPRHVVAASMLALEMASVNPMFGTIAEIVHETGVNILKDMYDARCLLCSITSPSLLKGPGSMVDMGRLFKHVKSRK